MSGSRFATAFGPFVARRLAGLAAMLWVVVWGGPALSRGLPWLLLAVVAAVLGSSAQEAGLRLSCLAAGALGSALAFALSPEVWPWAAAATASGALVSRPVGRELALGAVPVLVPLGLYLATRVLGQEEAARALESGMASGLPSAAETAVQASAIAAVVFLAAAPPADGSTADPRPALVSALAVASVATLLCERVVVLVRTLLLPTDALQWSEAPLLMNVVKLRAGEPLYSAPEEVRSFTYAPLFELLQAALLWPLDAELDIVAHRWLAGGWQLLAASLVGWSLSRLAAGATRLLAGLAGFAVTFGILAASPTSWFLHPDHAVHAVLAGAVLLSLGPLPPSRTGLFALVLAAPLATAFKMTGAGVGLGLGLSVLSALGRRAAPWLGLSALLSVLVVPAYELVFPGFREYGIDLLSRHVVHWERLGPLFATAEGRVIVLGAVVALSAPAGGRAPSRRLALLGLGALSIMGLAFLKEGGRENNLAGPAFVLAAAAIVALNSAASAPEVMAGPRLSATALVLLAPFMPRHDAGAAAEGVRIREDHRVVVGFVRGELAAGRAPLVHSGTTAWLEAGGEGAPRDALHPAIELYLAGHPAFEGHLERLARGHHGSIVTPGKTFTSGGSVGRPFGERLREAVSPRYCVVYPVDTAGVPVSLLHGTGTLILRRRDLGCEPLRP